MQSARKIGWQSWGVIAAIGFFALAAQTLLFRIFLTVFEGNELGIACFFSSWLTWVVFGALFARSRLPVMKVLCDHFDLLPLLYLPAYLLQWWLINHARELAGIRPYELFPLLDLLPFTFLINAPVSFCTGMLFTLACRWVQTTADSPVAKVYIWESAGGVLGGLAVTLLLARGKAEETLFLYAASALAVVIAIYRLHKRSYFSVAILVLAAGAALFSGGAASWEHRNNLHSWQRVLSTQTTVGSFTTPEAKYLYGEYGDQFNVVAWGTVADTIPATEHASEILALHLAQRPAARRCLVAGRGAFSICRGLLELPQTGTITWFDPDPAYPSHLMNVLPERFKSGVDRLEIPGEDIRLWLTRTGAQYDAIILNLPDATTLALNRYFTREFFQLLKAHLNEPGVIGVRVSAGENFMSEDLANAGASVFATLRSVFPHLVIKPGDESWLLASGSPGLSTSPATLRDRFAAIRGAAQLYPPEGLMALYQPQRVEYETQCFEATMQRIPGNMLLNTDRSPRALLHSLLFAAREAGGAASLGRAIRTLALHGLFVLPLGLVLFALLRLVFLFQRGKAGRSTDTGQPSAFDSYVLVCTTGAVGMGGSIVLMYLYQAAFGSIFLHIGLISTLFMLGLAAGSAVSARLIAGAARSSTLLLSLAILLQAFFCGVILFLADHMTRSGFAAAFVISGLVNGIYVPLAAARLNAAGVPPPVAGAWIEAVDSLGGAAGGLVTGLLLLPVFGTSYALVVLTLLLMTNLAAILPRLLQRYRLDISFIPESGTSARFREQTRAAGYILLGITVFVMAAGLLLRHGGDDDARQAFLAFARSAAGRNALQAQQKILADGKTLDYFRITNALPNEAGAGDAYVFQTDTLSPDVVGYGGPITLAVVVKTDGTLQDVRVLPSRETPSYLDYLKPWMQRLLGKNLFAPDPLKDVDAVTGATMTSAAVLRILRKAGPDFAEKALGLEVGPAAPTTSSHTPYREAIWLVVSLAIALALRARPSRRWRLGFLALVIAMSGFLFNMQYSLAHVFLLFGLTIPPFGWSTAFLLVAGVPVLVALFGNVYCGYLCPFGALQELVGELRPASIRTDPDKTAWAYGRFVKYLLLAFITLLFATTIEPSLASGDPLVMVFAHGRSRLVLCLAGLMVILAFFYPRFWCRTLCPTGAFLSLLNGIRLLRWLTPPIAPRACAYGVKGSRDLDCLCCDRCRRPGRQEQQAIVKAPGWVAAQPVNSILLAAAVALALALAVQTARTWRSEIAGAQGQTEIIGRGARPVDMKLLHNLIEQGRLSDQEALYYHTAPGGPKNP